MRTGWIIAGAFLFPAPFGFAPERQDPSGNGAGVLSDDPLKPGLVGSYWNVGKEMKEFPHEVTCDEANLVRTDGMINFDVRAGRGYYDLPWKEYFVAVWVGTLRLPKDSDYTFSLKSHDGSLLYLDGTLVIDHDGVHPFKESASKTVPMKAGDHRVRVEHFQNGRNGRCILSWRYDGVEKEVVPATAYWHRPEEGVDPDAK